MRRKFPGRVCNVKSRRSEVRNARRTAVAEPRLNSDSFTNESNQWTTMKMGGSQLHSHSEIYLQGPDTTKLNTVDVWTSESDVASTDNERAWVMFVSHQFFLFLVTRFTLIEQQLHSWRSLERPRGGLKEL